MIWLLIWCIIGVIAWLFTYHSLRKQWYDAFGYEYWKSNNNSSLNMICIFFPYWIFGGLLSLIYWMIMIDKKHWSLYFNIKRYERKHHLKVFRDEQK
jgi:Na+/melibiose symporter-like transporter